MAGIPVLLLKTRSQPDDGYEEYFSSRTRDQNASATAEPSRFSPKFVPVLEHKPNATNLSRLEELIRNGRLTDTYGGMIFTSQRAVEGFSDVVRKLDAEQDSTQDDLKPAPANDQPSTPTSSAPFPLYVVGPATARSLSAILPSRTLTPLHPTILGAHTGNGAALATYMLHHYNHLHSQVLFTYYEAPRLPFIPLIGPASGTYARKRMERDDARLCKRPLLFLVGEVRRDVIPKTLHGAEGVDVDAAALGEFRRIDVHEWEVYSTGVMGGFEDEFGRLTRSFQERGERVVVVVVFSPQGCEAMLRSLGMLDERGKATVGKAAGRWDGGLGDGDGGGGEARTRYVVATIGSTTRDHLVESFGFEPDVCAAKPSPEGVGEAVREFLRRNGLAQ